MTHGWRPGGRRVTTQDELIFTLVQLYSRSRSLEHRLVALHACYFTSSPFFNSICCYVAQQIVFACFLHNVDFQTCFFVLFLWLLLCGTVTVILYLTT